MRSAVRAPSRRVGTRHKHNTKNKKQEGRLFVIFCVCWAFNSYVQSNMKSCSLLAKGNGVLAKGDGAVGLEEGRVDMFLALREKCRRMVVLV